MIGLVKIRCIFAFFTKRKQQIEVFRSFSQKFGCQEWKQANARSKNNEEVQNKPVTNKVAMERKLLILTTNIRGRFRPVLFGPLEQLIR